LIEGVGVEVPEAVGEGWAMTDVVVKFVMLPFLKVALIDWILVR
jgi:hypothetical protein